MRHTEIVYLLALQRCPGIGPITARKLLEHVASPEELFELPTSKLTSLPGIGAITAAKLNLSAQLEAAQVQLESLQKNGIRILTASDPAYPKRLAQCPDAPLLLFAKGNMDLNAPRMLSIVGTRKPSAAGEDFCRRFIAELSPLEPVIVSGLAYGIDITCHKTALDEGLSTIGVLAHGAHRIYPAAHRHYAKQMLGNGGVLTEFQLGAEPLPDNFISRNRIVAGLSEATLVVESAEKGGSLVTASFARQYNREVFAVPGRASDPMSKGCNDLIRTQGAQLVSSAAELVYHLGWDLKPVKPSVQTRIFHDLDPVQQKIYDAIGETRKDLDNLARACGISVHQLSALLLEMELKGIVRPLPGKLFEAI